MSSSTAYIPVSVRSTARSRTWHIAGYVYFTFICYVSIGLPLAVLPPFVHLRMGYSAVLAGLAVSIQYIATLLSRPWAGRISDRMGAKVSVLWGMACCAASGAFLVGAAALHAVHWLSFAVLIASRLVLGVGESLGSTGSTLWGITSAGQEHTAKVIGLNGISTYGGMALAAPLGRHSRSAVGPGVYRRCDHSHLRGELSPWRGARIRFRLSPASTCPLRTCWAAWRRTAWVSRWAASATAFWPRLSRCIMPAALERGGALPHGLWRRVYRCARAVHQNHQPFRRVPGGDRFARLSNSLGMLLLWQAVAPWMALAGAAVSGLGFSLVFPAIGVEAVKRVPEFNRGTALGVYTAFADVSFFLVGPIAGAIIGFFGYASVFLFALISVLAALGIVLVLKEMQRRTNRPAALGSGPETEVLRG